MITLLKNNYKKHGRKVYHLVLRKNRHDRRLMGIDLKFYRWKIENSLYRRWPFEYTRKNPWTNPFGDRV